VKDITKTLAARGGTYGSFQDNAQVAQGIKDVIRGHAGWEELPDAIKEGLDLIALKISRIVTGDWKHEDNPHDIAGYAKLMEDFCRDHGR